MLDYKAAWLKPTIVLLNSTLTNSDPCTTKLVTPAPDALCTSASS